MSWWVRHLTLHQAAWLDDTRNVITSPYLYCPFSDCLRKFCSWGNLKDTHKHTHTHLPYHNLTHQDMSRIHSAVGGEVWAFFKQIFKSNKLVPTFIQVLVKLISSWFAYFLALATNISKQGFPEIQYRFHFSCNWEWWPGSPAHGK